jgi:DNA polymerase III subunit delta
MVALKAAEVDGFLARLDPARPIILVFGPDAGLVRERAEAIIGKAVDDPRDPFALARLDGDDLSGDPARLLDEAHTAPLFGGRRAVWVKAGGRNIAAAVEALIAAPPGPDCRVLIEAGDLRRGAPLRNACERARNVAAIACYVDGERDLARLIDEEMRAAGLTIASDARAALVALLGGDRLASRSEVRKLALYARGKPSVELDDILAVVADASALALDGVVDAAFAGRAPEVETQFAKARSAGTPASVIIGSALRQASQLHRARIAIEAGAAMENALGEIKPAVHFRREALVRMALAAWTTTRLERVMSQFADAVLETRRRPALADALGQRALLSVALSARRKD